MRKAKKIYEPATAQSPTETTSYIYENGKLLRQITIEGRQQALFREELSINDITRAYAMFERGLMYDWCICNGNYSLCQYSATMLPLFLKGLCR